MKKLIILVLIAILTISTFFLCGCNTVINNAYDAYDDLLKASAATIYDNENDKISKPKIQGEGGEFILIEFNEKTEFDTIVMRERTNSIISFSIQVGDSADELEQAYYGDTIGKLRVAYLGKTKCKFVKIIIDKCAEKYNVTNIEMFNIGTKNGTFRSVSYLINDRVDENTDFSSFEALTHVIVFNFVRFDGAEIVIQGETDEEKQKQIDCLNLIKTNCEVYGVEMIVDIGMNPTVEGVDGSGPMETFYVNRDKTIDNICEFLPKYGFEGVDFDWEYPYSKKETNAYNNFLVELDKRIPEYSISIAYGAWQRNLSKKAKEAIDRIEVMSYDLYDGNNYHANFELIVTDANEMVKKGFDKKKLDLGLPFYGRPLDRSANWPNYNDYYDKLGNYNNLAVYNDNGDMAYFNCSQIISDKTAFAIDEGFGGVMVWHFSCDVDYDSEFSLFAAINKTINNKLD